MTAKQPPAPSAPSPPPCSEPGFAIRAVIEHDWKEHLENDAQVCRRCGYRWEANQVGIDRPCVSTEENDPLVLEEPREPVRWIMLLSTEEWVKCLPPSCDDIRRATPADLRRMGWVPITELRAENERLKQQLDELLQSRTSQAALDRLPQQK